MAKEDKRRIALVDWDNTLRRGFTVVAWTEFLESAGLFEGARGLREKLAAFSPGIDNYEKFCEEMGTLYAGGLAGRRQRDVIAAAREFVRTDDQIFAFAEEVMAALKRLQFSVVVVSGAPDELIREYAARIGFTVGAALELQVRDGAYAGDVLLNSGLGIHKREAVRRLVTSDDVVLAFGDSEADVPLLDVAAVRFWVGRGRPGAGFPPGLVVLDPSLPTQTLVQIVKSAIAELLQK